MRLMTFIVMFFVMFNFGLFADAEQEVLNDNYEIIIGAETKKVTLERGEEIAIESTESFHKSFLRKVAAYSSIEGMTPAIAQEKKLVCTVKDPLELFKVVNYINKKRTPKDHSKDLKVFEFAEEVRTFFENNKEKDLKTEQDKDNNVLKVATPLRANSNCKVCHLEFSENKLVGVMVYSLPLK